MVDMETKYVPILTILTILTVLTVKFLLLSYKNLHFNRS